MRIQWVQERCEGFGACMQVAPEYFRLDEDGTVSVLVDEVPPEVLPAVVAGMRACPVAALRAVA
jgi:ferredoxin